MPSIFFRFEKINQLQILIYFLFRRGLNMWHMVNF